MYTTPILSLCHGISTERYKFRLPFPAKKASRAYLGNTTLETQRKKKAVLCGHVFERKPRKFRLSFAVFQYSNLSFPYLADLTILCKFFTLSTWRVAEKIGRRVEFFVIFVCIKGYQSSDSLPFKEAFVKRVSNLRQWGGGMQASNGLVGL